MFDYTYDTETGGLLLNDNTPTLSREPRPVYAPEMRLLHMDEQFTFNPQDELPYLWAEAEKYYYRGKIVAKTKGGTLCEPPQMDYHVADAEDGSGKIYALPAGTELLPVDLERMAEKNTAMLAVIEQSTVKRIYDYWKRFKKKLDCFHVAFSGGKDSVVLLELVKKALPADAFLVVFGDTRMEFPDTYAVVDAVEAQCKQDGIAFYRAASHLTPQESWRLFGPPSRTLRWCCTVHKATPQTLKIREILGQADYKGGVFLGVRNSESIKRSRYDFEELSKKQSGQRTLNPILNWNSAEIWLYLYSRHLPINDGYKKGNTRIGCLFCPQGEGKSESLRRLSYPTQTEEYMNLICQTTSDTNLNAYLYKGGWIARTNGNKLKAHKSRYSERSDDNYLYVEIIDPLSDWHEWIKTIKGVEIECRVAATPSGYICSIPKKYDGSVEVKKIKYVFHKAAYCIGCKACESNCPYGCIHFSDGVHIENCRHCMQCHTVRDGCLAYASLHTRNTIEVRKISINVLNDHAPKQSWLDSFFAQPTQFLKKSSLGPDQDVRFRRFLKMAGLIENDTPTAFCELVIKTGKNSDASWGLIYTNLAYDCPQMSWYIENMPVKKAYSREAIQSKLTAIDGISEKVAAQIVRSYKRLCETPLGTVLHMGTTEGKHIETLIRTKCVLRDDRVLLYALYRYAEACEDYYEFSLTRLMNTGIQSKGISPVKLFGLSEDEMVAMLSGLSAKHPDFINATFTHGLDKITLREGKTSQDVLQLFS